MKMKSAECQNDFAKINYLRKISNIKQNFNVAFLS